MKSGLIRACLLLTLAFPVLVWGQTGADLEVRVKTGDSLYHICYPLLENPNHWPLVAARNRMRNPDLIHPGEVVRIPIELTKGVPANGRVIRVEGSAAMSRNGADGIWQPLAMGQVVEEDALLKTEEKSTLELEFGNGVVLLLRPNTQIQVIRSRKQDETHFFHRLFIETGRAVSDIRKATGVEERFDIHTPSAVASVRGTHFRASVDRVKTTRCEVLKGEVRVRGTGRSVKVAADQGTVVRQNRAPAPPKKLLPPPKPERPAEIYKQLPLEITFQRIPNSVAYHCVLSKDPESRQVVREQRIRPAEPLLLRMLKDGAYYLKVSSIDDSGLEGRASDPIPIRLRTDPIAPFLQEPLDGSKVHGDEAPVHWLRVPDAKSYRFQVATDRTFGHLVEDRSDVRRIYNETKSLAAGDYCFRVASVAEDGFQSAWSDPVCFQLLPLPIAPEASPPEFKQGRMHIRWPDMGAGYRYHLQLSDEPGFSRILLDQRTERSELTLEEPERMGKYYLRISSIDPQGYESKFSTPQSFDVQRFPFVPTGAVLGAILLLILL